MPRRTPPRRSRPPRRASPAPRGGQASCAAVRSPLRPLPSVAPTGTSGATMSGNRSSGTPSRPSSASAGAPEVTSSSPDSESPSLVSASVPVSCSAAQASSPAVFAIRRPVRGRLSRHHAYLAGANSIEGRWPVVRWMSGPCASSIAPPWKTARVSLFAPALNVPRSASKKQVASRCAVTATAATLRVPAACAPCASTRSRRSRSSRGLQACASVPARSFVTG